MYEARIKDILNDMYKQPLIGSCQNLFDTINDAIQDTFQAYYNRHAKFYCTPLVNFHSNPLEQYNKDFLLKNMHLHIIRFIKFILENYAQIHKNFDFFIRHEEATGFESYMFKDNKEYKYAINYLSRNIFNAMSSFNYYVSRYKAISPDYPADASMGRILTSFITRFGEVHIKEIENNADKLSDEEKEIFIKKV